MSGDSLALARLAAASSASVIVLCGVYFMAETAEDPLPRPDRADPGRGRRAARSPTASPADQLRAWKAEHPGAAVVAYVNTSAEVKAEADVCCTSANAAEVVSAIPADREVLFLPDQFLGAHVRRVTGRPNLHVWAGECHVHAGIIAAGAARPGGGAAGGGAVRAPGVRLRHLRRCGRREPATCPRRRTQVLSTGGMLAAARTTRAPAVLVATETGMLHQLRKANPAVSFEPVNPHAICHYMKMITAESLERCLRLGTTEVHVDPAVAARARHAVEGMIAIGAGRCGGDVVALGHGPSRAATGSGARRRDAAAVAGGSGTRTWWSWVRGGRDLGRADGGRVRAAGARGDQGPDRRGDAAGAGRAGGGDRARGQRGVARQRHADGRGGAVRAGRGGGARGRARPGRSTGWPGSARGSRRGTCGLRAGTATAGSCTRATTRPGPRSTGRCSRRCSPAGSRSSTARSRSISSWTTRRERRGRRTDGALARRETTVERPAVPVTGLSAGVIGPDGRLAAGVIQRVRGRDRGRRAGAGVRDDVESGRGDRRRDRDRGAGRGGAPGPGVRAVPPDGALAAGGERAVPADHGGAARGGGGAARPGRHAADGGPRPARRPRAARRRGRPDGRGRSARPGRRARVARRDRARPRTCWRSGFPTVTAACRKHGDRPGDRVHPGRAGRALLLRRHPGRPGRADQRPRALRGRRGGVDRGAGREPARLQLGHRGGHRRPARGPGYRFPRGRPGHRGGRARTATRTDPAARDRRTRQRDAGRRTA